MLYFVIIIFLLSCAGHIESYERKIQHQINRTALMGETVILHCNETLDISCKDIGWHKDGTLIFIYSPVLNQTITNYTSSRMQVDPQNPRKLQISHVQLSDAGLYSCFPFNIHWILTIEDYTKIDLEIKIQSESSSYVVFSVITVCLAMCLFIFCAACLHGKWKEKSTCSPTETGNELAKTNKESVYHNETICVYTMTSSDNVATG